MNDSRDAPPQSVDRPMTPLEEFLLSQDAGGDRTASVVGHGHTPQNESRELSALLQGVGAFDLGFRAQIAVVGQDRARWLNGMLTNNILTLEEGHGNYNFILNVQGRIQGDGYVYRHGESLLLHTDRSQTQRLIDHLDHFIIMDDVELQLSNELTALGLAGPASLELLRKLGLAHVDLAPLTLAEVEIAGVRVNLIRGYSLLTQRYELWFERKHTGALWHALLDAGATACGAPAAEALRIVEGIPAYGVDLHDRDLPQETGQTRALNFSKGCYLGQEIVERIRSRGNVHRTFRQMELTGSPSETPAELRVNGKAVGQITSSASITISESIRFLALGFLRSEVLIGNPRIEYDGGSAMPIEKPFPELRAEFASSR